MKIRCLIWIWFVGICGASGVFAEVYKYTNEQGQTVFTDTPVENAVPVEIEPVMTYTPQVKPLEIPQEQPQDSEVGAYQSLRITSPQQQGTVRNNQGLVRVRFESVPQLMKGDQVILYLDGRPQPSFDVLGLERGEHTVQVAITDINGTEKIKSDVVTFYLHHQSRLFNQ